jgi:dihydroflavonol-4-reductase
MVLPAIIDLGFPLVDVRDVATAHVLAMENPSAKGRYITYNTTLKMRDVCSILRHFSPNHGVASLEATTAPVVTQIVKLAGKVYHTGILDFIRTHIGKFPLFSNLRTTQELGMVYTDIWASLRGSFSVNRF